jgi:hypothetical protein
MSTNPNQTTAQVLDQKMIAGVTKYFANLTQVMIAGTNCTPVAMKAVLQAEIDAITAANAAKAVAKQQVANATAARGSAHAFRKGLKAYILANYGASAITMLEDFGLTKPASKVKVATKATAVVKAKATRTARHTMGSKQKQAITGATVATSSTPPKS